ncbi:MAG: YraN family protein [Actinobacteria bacterium]|nr:YraN family protein [Actinomycetota bacterium]
MSSHNRDVGRYGEELACRYLGDRGFTVVARNWRCRHGEIDIVATDPRGVVRVIEVKTRRSTAHGTGAEAVTPDKLARLRRLCGAWLAENPHSGGAQVDVISILLPLRGTPALEHIVAVGW